MSELKAETDLQKIWHLLVRLNPHIMFALDVTRVTIIALIGIYLFFFAPASIESTIELSKRQLMGLLALCFVVIKWPKRSKKAVK